MTEKENAVSANYTMLIMIRKYWRIVSVQKNCFMIITACVLQSRQDGWNF